MEKRQIEKSLDTAINSFHTEVNDFIEIKHSEGNLETPMKDLANQFLYGGYLHVTGLADGVPVNKMVFLNAIEFYYHECIRSGVHAASRIKDYGMYHIPDEADSPEPKTKPQKEEAAWRKRTFAKGSLHTHVSGIDITFEDSREKDRFRASILIREYIVVDNLNFDNIEVEPRPTFLYDELMMGTSILGYSSLSIKWVDTIGCPIFEFETQGRIGLKEKKLVEGKILQGSEDDPRQWHFRRKDGVSEIYKHKDCYNGYK